MEVDGQKLDGGHAQVLQVFDHGWVSHACIGALELRGHVGMQLGLAAHMGFVDYCFAPRRVGAFDVVPIKVGGHPHGQVLAFPVRTDLLVNVPAIRVKQQLFRRRIHQEQFLLGGLDVRVEPVAGADRHAFHQTVVDAVGLVRQQHGLPHPIRWLEAHHNIVVVRRIHGNVGRIRTVFPGNRTNA